MYGLKTQTIQAIQSVFAKHPAVKKAILYGSRAKGNYRNGSDVDLTLVGQDLSLTELLAIENELDDLLLPYKIDLSIYHKIENPELIDHIERVGTSFYTQEKLRREWKEIELGQIAKKVTSGGTPSTKVGEYYDGDIPWLNTKEISFNRITSTEKTISESGLKNSSAKWIEKNSVIVAMYGATAAKVAINKLPLTTNQACCNLIINEELADYNFVFYAVWNNYDELENIAVGAAQQNLSVGVISKFPILLPPLDEQHAIASVLSSLDDKIDLLHRQNQTLEQMAETLFRQWFVEEADEGWEIATLNDVLSVKGGTTPSTKNPEYWDGDIHWTSPRDITSLNSIYLFDTERKITEAGLRKISSGLLPKGTLLMSSRAPVGVLAFAEVPIAINQGYIAVLDNKGFTKEFLYLWLKTNMDYVQSYANGSTFLEISKTAFKSLEIQIPPSELRNEFQEMTISNFDKIKSNQTQIRTLTALRDTLLPKLMRGEVRVLP